MSGQSPRTLPIGVKFRSPSVRMLERGILYPGIGDQAVKTGLEKTFELLAATENEAAVDALLPALSSPHEHIQECALRALLDRKSLAGQREVVRRWPEALQRWPDLLDSQRGRMSTAL